MFKGKFVNLIFVIPFLLFGLVAVFFLTSSHNDKSNTYTVTFSGKNQQPQNQDLHIASIYILATPVAVNLVNLELSFDNKVIEVNSLEFKDSALSIVLLSNVDNTNGIVKVLLAEPNPGFFSKEKANLVDIYYKKLNDDQVYFGVLGGTQVFSNDGNGTPLSVSKDGFFIAGN